MSKKTVSFFPGNVKSYFQNKVFDPKNIDDWNPVLIYLKRLLNQNDIEINTIDIPSTTPPDWYIYLDLPYFWDLSYFFIWRKIFDNKEKNILLCSETPIVTPHNYMKFLHFPFKKIFTWNDDWIDNKRYFKLHLPKNKIGVGTSYKEFDKKKFLVLINSNKSAFLPFKIINPLGKELYSERLKAIDFFEKNIPDKFYLYGKGWNKKKRYNLTETIFGFRKYSTYHGEIKTDGKIELLSNFKFCVCFENVTDVKGYITEKIVDCFKAGCVPIYWGASSIESYIPKDCFIDFRTFRDYDDLLKFLESIDKEKYDNFIKNIKKLMSNKKFIETWFEKGFGKFFLEEVLEL